MSTQMQDDQLEELARRREQEQQIANQQVPVRRYGSGVTAQTQQQVIQRRTIAQENVQKIDTATKQIAEQRAEQRAREESARDYARDYNQAVNFNRNIPGTRLENARQREIYIAIRQNQQINEGGTRQEKAFQSAGLTPIYQNGKIVGFKDEVRQQSIPLESVSSVVTQSPADLSRYQKAGVVTVTTTSIDNSKFNREGLEPITNSQGDVVGFKDSQRNQSYDLKALGVLAQSNPIEKARYERAGVTFNKPEFIQRNERVSNGNGGFDSTPPRLSGGSYLGSDDSLQNTLNRTFTNDNNVTFGSDRLQSGVSNSTSDTGFDTSVPVHSAPQIAEGYLEKAREKLTPFSNRESDPNRFDFKAFSASFAIPFVDTAILVKQIIINPKETLTGIALGATATVTAVVSGKGLPQIGQTIRTQPSKAFGLILGNYALTKLPTAIVKTSDFVRTAGLVELPETSVIAPEYFAGQTYPRIRLGQSAGELLSEFKKPVLPSELDEGFSGAGFTASPSSFKKTTQATRGSSELPGLYQAPRISPQFLKIAGEGDFSLVGLNPFGTVRPTALRTTPTSFDLAPGIKYGTTTIQSSKPLKVFFENAQKGKSYIPFIKTEKEAIIPFDTLLVFQKKSYFFKFQGRRIPILEYKTGGVGSTSSKVETIGNLYSRYKPESKPLVNPYTSAVGSKGLTLKVTETRSYYSRGKDGSSPYQAYVSISKSLSISSSSYSSSSYSPSSSSFPSSSSGSSGRSNVLSSLSYGGSSSSSYAPPSSSGGSSYSYLSGGMKSPYSKIKYPDNKRKQDKKGNLQLGFLTFEIKGGKKEYLSGVRPRGLALLVGQQRAQKTLRATFGIEPTKQKVRGKDIAFEVNQNVFRGYRIKKGKQVKLNNVFIQKTRKEGGARGGRLQSQFERGAIQEARSGRFRL